MEGELQKRSGGVFKRWNWKHFRLSVDTLSYQSLDAKGQTSARKSFSLRDCISIEEVSDVDMCLKFVNGTLHLRAQTKSECASWMHVLRPFSPDTLDRKTGVPIAITIERALHLCFDFLDTNAISTEGIFRVSGNITHTKALLQHLLRGGQISPQSDVHCVASVLKKLLAEIPEGLFLLPLYDKFMQVPELRNRTESINILNSLVSQLPESNLVVLARLCELFYQVALEHFSITRMSLKNLCIVFAPNLSVLRIVDPTKEHAKLLPLIELLVSERDYLFHNIHTVPTPKSKSFAALHASMKPQSPVKSPSKTRKPLQSPQKTEYYGDNDTLKDALFSTAEGLDLDDFVTDDDSSSSGSSGSSGSEDSSDSSSGNTSDEDDAVQPLPIKVLTPMKRIPALNRSQHSPYKSPNKSPQPPRDYRDLRQQQFDEQIAVMNAAHTAAEARLKKENEEALAIEKTAWEEKRRQYEFELKHASHVNDQALSHESALLEQIYTLEAATKELREQKATQVRLHASQIARLETKVQTLEREKRQMQLDMQLAKSRTKATEEEEDGDAAAELIMMRATVKKLKSELESTSNAAAKYLDENLVLKHRLLALVEGRSKGKVSPKKKKRTPSKNPYRLASPIKRSN